MWKVRFDPTGTRLLTTSRASVRVFDLDRMLAAPSFAIPGFPIAADAHAARIPIAHDVRELDYKGLESNWAVREGATAVELNGENYLVESRFAIFSPDGTIKVAIDPETYRARAESTSGFGLLRDFGELTVIDAAFSPDGRLAAVAETEEVVHLVETEDWQTVRTFGSHSPINLVSQDWSINDVAFSPNGRMLAAGFPRGVVRVWDTESGQLLHEWDVPKGAGVCVAFSPDGALLASGGTERPSTVWSLDSGNEVARLTGHRRTVLGLAFTADSRRLATISKDRTVKIWDPRTGRELLAVEEFPFGSEPLGIAFSASGLDLVVATNGRGLRVYRAFPWDPADYPGTNDRPIAERIELWKRREGLVPGLEWDALRRGVPAAAPPDVETVAANQAIDGGS
jgi:WD40 repeat protein